MSKGQMIQDKQLCFS